MTEMPASVSETSASASRYSVLMVAALLLLCAGTLFRVAPLLNQDGRLIRQWPTEDGYLMLTIARNMAIGNGMSTAEGTIPTNGTQPLCTFLWAGCFLIAGGDKIQGVLFVQILSLGIALLGAYLLYRLGRMLLSDWKDGGSLAALIAAIWYFSPNAARHSMNCLETGTVAVVLIGCAWYFLSSWKHHSAWSWPRCVTLGGLLGLAFWARIDASLFIASLCLVRLVGWLPERTAEALRQRLKEVLIFGMTSVVLASPWLIYNQTQFGSIMPISGTAQSASATFGENLIGIPAAVAEYVTVIAMIPAALERNPIVIVGCVAAFLSIVAVVALGWRRLWMQARVGAAMTLIWVILLVGWYGFLFGADHFLSRYLFPLSPFFAIAVVVALWMVAEKVAKRPSQLIRSTFMVAVLVVAGFLNVRLYRQGNEHAHFQVVEWVEENVPDETWVGAIQTGTLGYYHDRTINLDGKVNPYALEAKLKDDIPRYILSTPIQYLADWIGIALWHDRIPLIRDNFTILECDKQVNIAVLKRE